MTSDHFSYLFRKHEQKLFYFCRKLTQSHELGKDLLQNSTIKGYLNREDLISDDKFKSWMSSIIYNAFLSSYRKKKRRRKLMKEKGAHGGHFFNKTRSKNNGYERLKEEDIKTLTEAVGSDSYKAFQLYYKGYSYKEIAQQLDIALGTVKSRIYFVRKKMKETKLADIYAA